MDSLLPKSKVCSKCAEEKLLGEFTKSKPHKLGRHSQCRKCKAAHYQKNKVTIDARHRKYYQKNKPQINEYERDKLKNDEQFRIRKYLSIGLWSALNKIGKRKNASILTYIGCSIEYLQEHLNSTKNPEWGDDLHIDHIIPKTAFDYTVDKEVLKCENWRNLRYLPAEENMSKRDKLDMDLVKSYGIEDLLPEGFDKCGVFGLKLLAKSLVQTVKKPIE